ncbi:diguanylate cyclase domain-containing protein [Massilia sp. GCM10020059]|uniref:Diguanylate cyclase n=1 Tax=Massilia agrisoli TaxID=2892444 RepID=A0ABS8IV60_9BURK|nr:GGDEF domain-containing protein [Massilia agrisoli]MCC6072515.1 diguanylate cyclase [Massilia agrisoli]
METRAFTPPAGFVDLLLDAVCVVDAEGRFLFVSAACERIFGYRPEEMVGTLMIDMVAPEDRERTLDAARKIMAGDCKPNFENCYLRKDGSRVHILWSARWSQPNQVRIAVAHDITERKRAEALQAALYAISEAVHTAGDLCSLYPQIHCIINNLLPAPGFTIALFDATHEHLDFPYHVPGLDDASAASAAAHHALCEHVSRTGQPLLLKRASPAGLPDSLRDAAEQVAPCWLGLPLASGNGVIGALVVMEMSDSPCYTERDQELLQFVSTQIATAIERKRLHSQLRHMAQHDALTGLPNRMLLLDRLDTALARARRDIHGFSLLYVDLDKFKPINDLHGHETGDKLLQEVARRISHCVRDSDTVARLGGDEFVVLLDRACLMGDAEVVAEKISAELCSAICVRDLQLFITPSIGIAVYPEHGDTPQQLLRYADDAMYQMKKSQRTH